MPLPFLSRQQLDGIGVSVFVPAAAEDSFCIPACSTVVPR